MVSGAFITATIRRRIGANADEGGGARYDGGSALQDTELSTAPTEQTQH